jgi:hypothetical protein
MNMFWKDFLCALLISLGLSAVFIAAFRRRGPWGAFLFFVVVFLAAWAGGIWLPPMGPPIGGVYWLPFLIVGLIFALLLAAVVSPTPSDTTVQLLEEGEKGGEEKKSLVLGIYFWIMVFALLVLILSRYFRGPH